MDIGRQYIVHTTNNNQPQKWTNRVTLIIIVSNVTVHVRKRIFNMACILLHNIIE